MLNLLNICIDIYKSIYYSFLSTSAVKCKTVQNTDKSSSNPTEDYSFTMNIFRGQIESKQVFPFPDVLNEEQHDTLKMLVDPVQKFFEVHLWF